MGERDSQAPDSLNSWKEIAGFLGVNVRTAQRWESQRGMPVRRFAGEKGRVAASPAELSAWHRRIALEKVPFYRNLGFLQCYAAVSTGLIAVLLAAVAWTGDWLAAAPPPAAIHLDFRTLIVADEKGRELWRRVFSDPFAQDAYSSPVSGRTVWFGDLDGDGRTEVVFAYYPTAQGRSGSSLYCFSSRGEVKWHFSAGRAVADQNESYDAIFWGTDFVVGDFAPPAGRLVVLTSHSLNGHPNQVTALDPSGRVRAEYWHSGHLDAIAVAASRILLAGIDNARRSATLVVLDPRSIGGAQQIPGSPFQLKDLPAAREQAVVWFPRSCINRATDAYNIAKAVRFDGRRIEVYVHEKLDDPSAAAIYTLTPDLKVEHVKFSDHFEAVHARMHREAQLDHAFSPVEIQPMYTLERR